MRVLRWIVALVFILGLAVFLIARWAEPKKAPNSLLFYGGSIVSMSAEGEVEALWIRDGRIERLGSFEELRTASGEDVKLVDLAGATLMPGFIEPHTHPLASAMLGAAIDVSGFTHGSREELMATLHEATSGFSPQPWIIAFGWDPIMMRGLAPPTLEELDELFPDKPLVILTQAMHEAFANSAALAAAGISRDTQDPQRTARRRSAASPPAGRLHRSLRASFQ